LSVTAGLVSIVVLLGAVLAWRLARWRWRPALRLEPDLRADGTEHHLPVRNAGASTARRCRARLMRTDRREDGTWRRLSPDPEAFPLTWPDGSGERDLEPGEASELLLARGNRLPPGRYRIEVAVIDGHESRLTAELIVSGPEGPGGRDG
jgi:hypothetical protein